MCFGEGTEGEYMLQRLHVKNLALMEEAEVEFAPGLNILTGETGAGKSMLLGSMNLALGAKFEKDMLRSGAESALVELVFSCEENVRAKLSQMELDSEGDEVIITRRLQPGKSVLKINGETVTARQVKELAEVLLDIHGQHEHQSLLHKKKHREILDAYCGEDAQVPAGEVADLYRQRNELLKKLEAENMDESARTREQSLAEYELNEIESAHLVPGEDEELEQLYRRMSNSQKIKENLAESYQYTGTANEGGAGELFSRALRSLRAVTMYDARIEAFEAQLSELDGLLADYNRDMSEYIADCEFDEEEFARVEERLNTVNRLKGKYGNSIQEVLDYAKDRREQLDKLADYDSYISGMKAELEACENSLREACRKLSDIRSKHAVKLTEKLKEALVQLNFLTVQFEVAVRPEQTVTEHGSDDVEFMISTNPGEVMRPLGQAASGGELSRVMLAIKTVLAGKDAIDTLIFDEIDAGISGKTAWKVAGQLNVLSKAHQVICITHLPQIAAMADAHFIIEKSSTNESTFTQIYLADETQEEAELARLLGSDELTEAALSNARELRKQALEQKQKA